MDRTTHNTPSLRALRPMHHVLTRACLLAGATALFAPLALGAPAEPPIIPTVHPTLTPLSAIMLPVGIRADKASVWARGLDQRMLVSGRLRIDIGYRTLRANDAAIFLTPSKDGGEATYDLAIYLSGDVAVEEGVGKTSTVTKAKELIVTSRISNAIQLNGAKPVSEVREDSEVYKRGEELRQQLLTLPPQLVHIPTIKILDTERALQAGWIARGPGNKIVTGPGEAIATGMPEGAIINGQPEGVPGAPPPKPRIFATGEHPSAKVVNGELVTLIRGDFFLLYSTPDEKPPIVMRAQRAVLFGPKDKDKDKAATDASGVISQSVTMAYVEGDVTIEQGNQTIRAERMLYDFTTQRAIMLDATLSTVLEDRNVPIYLRAAEIRQLARSEYNAKSAKFSLSEFYTPHYHIGASNAYLHEITPEGVGAPVFAVKATDVTFNAQGQPFFWWPYLAGDTSQNNIPLERISVGYSKRYGLTLETAWNVFSLLGVTPPPDTKATLQLDYWGKRGPGFGFNASQKTDESESILKSYILQDHGDDDLAVDRNNITISENWRGRAFGQHRQTLDDNWSLQIEGAYVSDPTFLEQFFQSEFDTDPEHQSSIYVKRVGETDALTFFGKWYFYDFVTNADLYADQFTNQKAPEVKYWRIGDSLLDTFTYYSENGVAGVNNMISNTTPNRLGLASYYPAVGPNQTFRNYYQSLGWTTGTVVRGDSRHEIDMPLQLGDVKVTPYITGRVTAWDDEFPETSGSGSTVRLWGATGVRGATQFWRVYDDVENQFFDLHRMRHIIEPQFNLFLTGATKGPEDLQPFDRDVEQITRSSAAELTLHQTFQTQRGGVGHYRNVDWLVLDASVVSFFNEPNTTTDNPYGFIRDRQLRGLFFMSRPELSQVRDAFNVNAVWRIGERVRYIFDSYVNLENGVLEALDNGIAIDQSPSLSWFIGNRYVQQDSSNEITLAFDYQLTRKYELIFAESYDVGQSHNVLTSATIIRKFPRLTTGLTIAYDANTNDTSVVVTVSPEGFPNLGFGSPTVRNVPR